MTFFQKIAQVCALALILTGCSTTARKDMELHDDCFHKQSRIVIAQISGLEKARFFRLGEQGFVDLIINSAMTDGMAEKVEVIDTKSLLEEHYYGPFERFLSQHCLEVSKMYEPLDREKLAPSPIDEEKYAPYDFRQLKKTGAQYAVILHPQQFGAQRYYKGFIPLGPPHAITSLRVYMVRLSDNTLVGHYNVAKVHEVQGAWDNPPEYKELIRAVEGSLGEALEEADMYFFGDFVGDLEG